VKEGERRVKEENAKRLCFYYIYIFFLSFTRTHTRTRTRGRTRGGVKEERSFFCNALTNVANRYSPVCLVFPYPGEQ
jgi:hypothetical protein